uniref:Uncharacterized protein n=1 Tax=Amphimedon queenslandica TaxID=400682 RepID=A0A1X7TTW3_AMPQE
MQTVLRNLRVPSETTTRSTPSSLSEKWGVVEKSSVSIESLSPQDLSEVLSRERSASRLEWRLVLELVLERIGLLDLLLEGRPVGGSSIALSLSFSLSTSA